jgi:hypothetical protein
MAHEALHLLRSAIERVPASRVLHNAQCRTVLKVGLAMLEGELAFRQKNYSLAWKHLRRAGRLEDGLPYDEPAGWMVPTRHALGALSLERALSLLSRALSLGSIGQSESEPESRTSVTHRDRDRDRDKDSGGTHNHNHNTRSTNQDDDVASVASPEQTGAEIGTKKSLNLKQIRRAAVSLLRQAEEAYLQDLFKYPRNVWALRGLLSVWDIARAVPTGQALGFELDATEKSRGEGRGGERRRGRGRGRGRRSGRGEPDMGTKNSAGLMLPSRLRPECQRQFFCLAERILQQVQETLVQPEDLGMHSCFCAGMEGVTVAESCSSKVKV